MVMIPGPNPNPNPCMVMIPGPASQRRCCPYQRGHAVDTPNSIILLKSSTSSPNSKQQTTSMYECSETSSKSPQADTLSPNHQANHQQRAAQVIGAMLGTCSYLGSVPGKHIFVALQHTGHTCHAVWDSSDSAHKADKASSGKLADTPAAAVISYLIH